MTEVQRLWTGALPPFPAEEIAAVEQAAAPPLRQVCDCFWLFRYLHGFGNPACTLLGDYCFGRFSRHMAALDNVPLTDAFAEYLKRDCTGGADLAGYLAFVRGLGGLL